MSYTTYRNPRNVALDQGYKMLDSVKKLNQDTDLAAAPAEPKPGEIYKTPEGRIHRVVCTAYCPEMKDVLVVTDDLQGEGQRATTQNMFRGGKHPFAAWELVGMSA